MELAPERALVQSLNILQSMLKSIAAEIDFVFRDRVEHERVVWIGRMTQTEYSVLSRHGRTLSVSPVCAM